jgi:acyl-CoA synthetase (AMP-forming)/AMP-acid ligase II
MSSRCTHLADILELLADEVPDRLAVATGHAERTFAELDERATRLANHLAAEGVRPGDHVAIHSSNCVEWVEAFYGCFKLRGVPININYRYVAKELRYLYDNADCVAAVVSPDCVAAVDDLRGELPGLRHRLVIGDEYEAALAAAPAERDFAQRSPDDRYIVYTGGTTGMPKGVLWRQEDIVLGAMNTMRQGRSIDRVERLAEEALAAPQQLRLMAVGPLMHGGSQWVMGGAHVAGGAAVIYSDPRFDPNRALRLAADTAVNLISVLGDAFARPLAEAMLDWRGETLDLSQLGFIGNGAAPLSMTVREQLHAALPNAAIIDAYGSSETGATATRPDDLQRHSAPRFDIGPDVRVVAPDLSHFCAPGEMGLLARSGHIPLGYWKDPERTAQTFPTIGDRRWVIPGDLARVEEDDSISLLGRGSTSINTGGEKLHPEEVISTLLEHPAVLDAAVTGTPHPHWGEQVTALVKVRTSQRVSADELRTFCRPWMAAYKIPKEILFVEQVPATLAGKLDYPKAKELARRLLEHGEPKSSGPTPAN